MFMMRNKIKFFAIGVLISMPLMVGAQSSDQSTIAPLQAQIAALQAQIFSLVQYQQALPSPTAGSNGNEDEAPPTTVASFDGNLYLGMRNDPDVSNLQEFLTDQGFYSSTITGNFFILTKRAVQKFQAAHGLNPTGYFGPMTRAVANQILIDGGGGGVSMRKSNLSIVPASAQLKVGESIEVKAFLRGHPIYCIQAPCPQPVDQQVNATFTSSDPSVVALVFSGAPGCATCNGPAPTAIRGVSPGTAIITATYIQYPNAYTATMQVTVAQSATTGSLYIVPLSAQLKVGENVAIKAYYQPPEPACLHSIPACRIPTPGPQEVSATFVSSNPSVATVDVSATGCATCAGNLLYSVRGISPGKATITASYIQYPQAYAATMQVTVVPSSAYISVIFPKQGDQWVAGKTYRITWSPFPSTSDTYVYLSGGGHEEGYSKYIGSPSIPTNYYVDYMVTNSDLPVTSRSGWKVAVCDGKMQPGGNNCGWSGEIFIIPTASPSITVLIPNGGEQYQQGAPIIFGWYQNYNSIDLHVHLFDSNSGKEYYVGPLSGSIGKNAGTLQGEAVNIPVGSYRITICDEGTRNPFASFKPLCDSSDAPFSIVAGVTVAPQIDLEVRGVTRGDFHPYGFYTNFCVNGPNSVNDLKKTNPTITGIPTAYVVYDVQGGKHRDDTSATGFVEDLKNGQCSNVGWTIQAADQSFYDQTKRIDYIVDPNNIIAETNERNNSGSYSTSSITVLSPNGGEAWQLGSTQTIKWSSSNVPTVMVDLIRPGYECHLTNGDVSNTGSLNFTVSSCVNGLSIFSAADYKIRVMYRSNATVIVQDDSDAPFWIL